MRSLSTPTQKGAAIIVGPAMTCMVFYCAWIFLGTSSLFLFIFFFIIGLVLLSASILFAFGFMELSIDMKNRQWTESINIFNWRTASMSEEIPTDLNYILIFDAGYSINDSNAEIISDNIYFYEVSVVYNNNRKKVFCLTSSRAKASKISEQIQSIFNLEIIDKTID